MDRTQGPDNRSWKKSLRPLRIQEKMVLGTGEKEMNDVPANVISKYTFGRARRYRLARNMVEAVDGGFRGVETRRRQDLEGSMFIRR